MELDDLQLFCRIAALGSFAAAAESLQLSNGTVSRRLDRLERSLGTSLITRSTRSMELTEFGQNLYRRGMPLIGELEALRQELLSRQTLPSGRISVLLPMEFFAPQFSRVLSGFAAQYPDIRIDCSHYAEAFPAYVSDRDLGFAWYEEALPDSDWIATPLMSLPQGCYASPELAGLTELAALAEHRCVPEPKETQWRFRSGKYQIGAAVDGPLRFNSPNMRLQAAVNAGGICKVPCYLGDDYVKRGLLKKLALEAEPVALVVALLYRGHQLPYRLRAFIDYFQSHIDREIQDCQREGFSLAIR